MVHCFDIQIKICFIFFCCLLKFFVKGFMEGLELQARTDLSRLISAMWKLNILHTISVCWLYFAGCILPVVFCIFFFIIQIEFNMTIGNVCNWKLFFRNKIDAIFSYFELDSTEYLFFGRGKEGWVSQYKPWPKYISANVCWLKPLFFQTKANWSKN